MSVQHNKLSGVVTFNCHGIKSSVKPIQDLCKKADIIALQETWLLPHDLGLVNKIDKEFSCWSNSSVDTSVRVLKGRPYGGMALMWRTNVFTSADIVQCNNDRIGAVRLAQGERSVLVFSVYMPTNDEDRLPEFCECLAQIGAIIESSETECVMVLGDFNAHPNTLFGKELEDFCGEQSLRCIDRERLDPDTFTYVSDMNGACRWLDHCIVTEAAASLVTEINVNYGSHCSDHFPLVIKCDFKFIRSKIVCDNNQRSICTHVWGNREPEQIQMYSKSCDEGLQGLIEKYNLNCLDNYLTEQRTHREYINALYSDLVLILQKAADQSYCKKPSYSKGDKITGWNFHVRQAHRNARDFFLSWVQCGRPRNGYCYDNMTASRREFKAALKYVRNNQDKVKMDMLAKHCSSANFIDFWKEVKKLDNKICIPVTIEGESNQKSIANLFKKHFDVSCQDKICLDRDQIYEIEKQVQREPVTCHVTVTPKQIEVILRNMKRGKSPGHDGLSIEHLLYAGQYICVVLARFFSLCVKHCYLPEELIRTLVVPITKNKTGDISSVANYRPISLATVVAKVGERVIHSHLKKIHCDDGQFGFRPQVSTDMAIFSLKQIVRYYRQQGTTVYACFLDLSRAFDTVNHDLLWRKLRGDASVPADVVDLLEFWYRNQTSNVRWGKELSDRYQLSCGVRQGGLTSPDLFNVYVNELIEELSSTPVGLKLDGRYVNNLSYADDMVLLSPSIKGLRKLLTICERYAKEHNLSYNAKKTEMIVFRSGKGPDNIPVVCLSGRPVEIVSKFKYLGHIVTSNLKDDADIERQRRSLCIVGNMIARRFYRASSDVKIMLFKTYCQSFYTCQLWTDYTVASHDGIRVTYNNIFRHLMGLKRYCSVSEMYTEARVHSFNAIQRMRIASFMSRVDMCKNSIIKSLADRLMFTETYRKWVSITH